MIGRPRAGGRGSSRHVAETCQGTPLPVHPAPAPECSSNRPGDRAGGPAAVRPRPPPGRPGGQPRARPVRALARDEVAHPGGDARRPAARGGSRRPGRLGRDRPRQGPAGGRRHRGGHRGLHAGDLRAERPTAGGRPGPRRRQAGRADGSRGPGPVLRRGRRMGIARRPRAAARWPSPVAARAGGAEGAPAQPAGEAGACRRRPVRPVRRPVGPVVDPAAGPGRRAPRRRPGCAGADRRPRAGLDVVPAPAGGVRDGPLPVGPRHRRGRRSRGGDPRAARRRRPPLRLQGPAARPRGAPGAHRAAARSDRMGAGVREGGLDRGQHPGRPETIDRPDGGRDRRRPVPRVRTWTASMRGSPRCRRSRPTSTCPGPGRASTRRSAGCTGPCGASSTAERLAQRALGQDDDRDIAPTLLVKAQRGVLPQWAFTKDPRKPDRFRALLEDDELAAG